jgi:hypothetical protein
MTINHTAPGIVRQQKLGSIRGKRFVYIVTDIHRVKEMALWGRVNLPGRKDEVEFVEKQMDTRFIFVEKFRIEDNSKVGDREILVGTRQLDAERAHGVLRRYITDNGDISLNDIEVVFENNTKKVPRMGVMVEEPDPIPNTEAFDAQRKMCICRYAKRKFNIPMNMAYNAKSFIDDFGPKAKAK